MNIKLNKVKQISDENNNKKQPSANIKTIKIGTRKKATIFLWGLLMVSILLGIYNNFTAVDTKTIVETKELDKRLVDTNSIENFVGSFARTYYTWNNTQQSLNHRSEALKGFLSKDLQNLNEDSLRNDITTKSTVQSFQIWSVEEQKDNYFEVLFSITQSIHDSHSTNNITSAYNLTVYVDENHDMVITTNPTITSLPSLSNYQPEAIESDTSITDSTQNEIEDFLTTFFKLYPKADEKEISYYVRNNVLKPIHKDYVFAELINPVYRTIDDKIHVNVTVKYLNNETKATELSQYEFVLQKNNNWQIIE